MFVVHNYCAACMNVELSIFNEHNINNDVNMYNLETSANLSFNQARKQ